MSNIYQRGIGSGHVAIPHQATMALDRFGRITSGSNHLYRGGQRFYGRGIVGANTTGFVGSVFDGLVALVLDCVHVILLVGGAWMIWKAVAIA